MKKKLSNGYFIESIEIYNGFTIEYRYGIFTPEHKIICSCTNYKQALQMAISF